MIVLAIDPGSTDSAYVLFDSAAWRILEYGKSPNPTLLASIRWLVVKADALAIEYPAPRGQPLYTQLVDTIFWIGRFVEASGGAWYPVDRKDVKMHLCGNTKAGDSNIRAAVISRFTKAGRDPVGKKKNPGPLYGISGDVWAALAVGVTFAEREGFLV
jgi:hypothetical protein